MATILIKNGRVWDGEKFFYSDVYSSDGKILKIAKDIHDNAEFIYDASGKIVSAGLVDAHMHIKGISCEIFGTQGEASCFPFGVTSAVDAGASHGTRELLDSFTLKNVVLVTALIKNNKFCPEHVEERIKVFGDKVVGIKVYFDVTQTEVANEKPLKEICDYAHERGLFVMVHCANSPTKMANILNTLGKGDVLTHSFHGQPNTAKEDDYQSMIKAQERGVIIDIGFAGHVHTDFDVLKCAIDKGIVPNVISTDLTRASAFIRGGRYGMTMCMSIAKDMGLKEEDVFKAVTSNPATVLAKQDEWGYLREGRSADLTVLEYADESYSLTDKAGNHIESDKGYRAVLTILNGQIVYRR